MSGGAPVEPAELATVRAVLAASAVRPARAWIFGSRASGTARRFSDPDLESTPAGG